MNIEQLQAFLKLNNIETYLCQGKDINYLMGGVDPIDGDLKAFVPRDDEFTIWDIGDDMYSVQFPNPNYFPEMGDTVDSYQEPEFIITDLQNPSDILKYLKRFLRSQQSQ